MGQALVGTSPLLFGGLGTTASVLTVCRVVARQHFDLAERERVIGKLCTKIELAMDKPRRRSLAFRGMMVVMKRPYLQNKAVSVLSLQRRLRKEELSQLRRIAIHWRDDYI